MDTVNNRLLEMDWYEVPVGMHVCDMHYGTAQLLAHATIVSHITWNEPEVRVGVPLTQFWDHLNCIQQTAGKGHYTNKFLIVIGKAERVAEGAYVPQLTCGYSYDGRRNGIIVLERK